MSTPIGAVVSAPSPARIIQPELEPTEVRPGKFAQRLRELQQAADAKASAVPLALRQFVRELEIGQAHLDRLVTASTSGRKFTNAELLGLQATMYRYTIEIDLLSKLVQSMANGLKDLLKMQV